jgi:hypothetical protein
VKGKGGKIAILLGMKPGMGGEDEEDGAMSSQEGEDEEGPSMAEVSLAKQMMRAKDAEAFASALKAFIYECMPEESED